MPGWLEGGLLAVIVALAIGIIGTLLVGAGAARDTEEEEEVVVGSACCGCMMAFFLLLLVGVLLGARYL